MLMTKIRNKYKVTEVMLAITTATILLVPLLAQPLAQNAIAQPDTAFVVPENLDLEEIAKFTSTDNARATQIFLTNSEVQRMINGKPYEIAAIGVGTPDLAAKPPKFYITFNIAMEDKVLAGAVDLGNRTVINLTESERTNLG